jgi:hypothetical protein
MNLAHGGAELLLQLGQEAVRGKISGQTGRPLGPRAIVEVFQ